jgi:protocatechuate 3,4-dioxygenase beta subunit
MPTNDETQNQPPRRGLRRRDAFVAMGTLGLGGVLGATRLGSSAADAEAAATASCVLTPEVTEGPYWIDNALRRHDVRAGRPGLPLEIVFTVENARTCRPIANADVEIWHCDAEGVYSGYQSQSQGPNGAPGQPPAGGPPAGAPPGGAGTVGGHQTPTDGSRSLRGHQRSGADGKVSFLTIFPGWYRGRTPHVHLKVHVGGRVIHTGQVFFDEAITAAVYKRAPYKAHGQPDTSHAADTIFAAAGKGKAILKLRNRAGGRPGYRGTITLGVATS